MSQIVHLKNELLSIIHFFNAKGWSPATSGNYSFRNPTPNDQTFTISRSGVDKSAFSQEDFIEVDTFGCAINANPERTGAAYVHIKPSAETLIHTMLYTDSKVGAVLHTHSVFNTVLSEFFAKTGGINIVDYEVIKGIGNIKSHETAIFLPIFPNSQDIATLSDDIRVYLSKNPDTHGLLLAGHGLYTWGSTLAEAKRHIEAFEFLMECIYRKNTMNSM